MPNGQTPLRQTRRTRSSERAPGRRHGVRAGAAAGLLVAVLASSSMLQGQIPIDDRFSEPQRFQTTSEVLVEESPAVINLFARANEGVNRADWKFVIDSLQRLIDGEEISLLSTSAGAAPGGIRYEDSRHRAVRELVELPPEAISAYRILYDGKARRLLQQAREEHDVAVLRELLARYLLTSVGPEAVDLYSSWKLEAGDPEAVLEAIELYDQTWGQRGEVVPDEITQRLAYKQAAAYSLLGRGEAARQRLGSSSGTDEQAAESGWSEAIARLEPLGDAMDAGHVDDWPRAAGDAARHGLMDPVEPSFATYRTWVHRLPGVPTDFWHRAVVAHGGVIHRPPVGRPMLVNDRLFARTSEGCLALDAETFSVAWDTRFSAAARLASRMPWERELLAAQRPVFDDWETALFDDSVGAAISLGQDQVYLVRRTGGAPIWDPNVLRMRRFRFGQGDDDEEVPPNRLVALDADTGEPVWATGSGQDSSDALRLAQFRAVPLAVGDDLWVPYLRNKDLIVGRLSPRDGTLQQEVLLCTVDSPSARLGQSLDMAFAGDRLFVPSAHGVLFAVDTKAGRLAWASEYAQVAAPFRHLRAASDARWWPTPPVVEGGVVVLAPSDQERMYAFSTHSGELLWTWKPPYRDYRYIIAAAGGRLWVGGTRLACLSLADGKLKWSTNIPARPTGRAVLSGEKILVPTVGGLLTVGAIQGRHQQMIPQHEGDEPLGNILCLDDMLYSLDPVSVRRYPDMVRGYPLAKARWAKAPADPLSAIRLASLELLRDAPDAALAAIEPAIEAARTGDGDYAGDLIHLRVDALLRSAMNEDLAAEEQLRLTDEAYQSAERVDDRLRSLMQRADLLLSAERPEDAYRVLWSLGVESEPNRLLEIEPGLELSIRPLIGQRLRHVQSLFDPEAGARLKVFVRSQVGDEQGKDGEADRLAVAADLGTLDGVDRKALSLLGSKARSELRFETAEQYLRCAVRRKPQSGEAVAGRMMLAELYHAGLLLADGVARPLVAVLDELERQFGDRPIPDWYNKATGIKPSTGSPATVAEWVASLRDRFAGEHPTLARRLQAGTLPLLEGKVAWEIPFEIPDRAPEIRPELRLLEFSEAGTPPPAGRVIFRGRNGLLECRDAARGDVLWRTMVRQPGEFRWDPPSANYLFDELATFAPTAVLDGQTLVLGTNNGIHAIGLMSGKRLWVRSYDARRAQAAFREGTEGLAAGGGVVAAMVNAGRLVLMRTVDGSILWERDLKGESADHIEIAGDRVLAMDRKRQRVMIIDRETGLLIKKALYEQPDATDIVDVVHTAGIVCGPDYRHRDEVISAVRLSDGDAPWEVAVPDGVVSLFVPAEGVIGAGLLRGRVWLIRAETGEVFFRGAATVAERVIDGVMHGDSLVTKQVVQQDGVAWPRLSALDLATGAELWDREDLGPLVFYDLPLRLLGDHLPVVTVRAPQKPQNLPSYEIEMISLQTGRRSGEYATMLTGNARRAGFQVTGEAMAWDEAFVVGYNTTVRAYRIIRE